MWLPTTAVGWLAACALVGRSWAAETPSDVKSIPVSARIYLGVRKSSHRKHSFERIRLPRFARPSYEFALPNTCPPR